MEQLQPVQSSNASYWTSVTVASFLFGIITFAISLLSNYAMINSEPTGSPFSPIQLIGILACLFGAFGGMLATWHYAKEYEVSIKLGKGALIGFLTGVGITIVTIILSQIWQIIDPDMVENMVDSTVASLEAMDLPSGQKQTLIDSTVQGIKSQQSIGTQLLWGIPINGILNLLTGMIGAKIFGKEEHTA
jgi:uncharacterized membrane protein YidH (DUF202 family)